jgi:hypothetical protein
MMTNILKTLSNVLYILAQTYYRIEYKTLI